jgi:hypothetical protein
MDHVFSLGKSARAKRNYVARSHSVAHVATGLAKSGYGVPDEFRPSLHAYRHACKESRCESEKGQGKN